jgi:undecaprenyl pyrophosphate phosphatase UppP
LVIAFLFWRDYLAPCYRDPAFPKITRNRRAFKLVFRVFKWTVTIYAASALIGGILLSRWQRLHLRDLCFLAGFALVTAALWWADHRIKWPEPIGRCQKCGYDLTGNVSGRCPECGTPVPPPE